MKLLFNRFKNFGLLEALVIFSAVYVISMLLWTATTRSAVQEKAETVKSNHNKVVDFINSEINLSSSDFLESNLFMNHLKFKNSLVV